MGSPTWNIFAGIDFPELALFFAIPLLILGGCWMIQRQWKMRLNSGVDLFVFLMSLDLALLIWYDTGSLRINPLFAPIYRPLFGALCAMSFFLLGYSNLVQWRIHDTSPRAGRYYPLLGVTICWLFALAGIAFHLYVILGGAPWVKQ